MSFGAFSGMGHLMMGNAKFDLLKNLLLGLMRARPSGVTRIATTVSIGTQN